uniref:nuclear transcription factor Y subunit B-5-like n=1 Tax=Erigeron canadensis TaxID=72917 RepID=UPI001CB9D119|nr:nuclear transcription factor Y subunit B-5-like [Erigeron canadensis]
MVHNNIGSNSGREILNFTFDAGGTSTTTSHHHQQDQLVLIKEQDRLLPIANVGRIMKQILPPNAKISKEAKETMQECVSEFISFVTGEASDHCRKEKRKTVNGDDVCWAMLNLGFDDYTEPLKKYLHKIRELDGERANHNNNKGGAASSSSNEEKLDHTNNIRHAHHHQETSSNYRSTTTAGNQVPQKAIAPPSTNLFKFNVIDKRNRF